MFYVIFAIFAFLIRIHANPLPQSSNELINARQHSTEATSDIFSLSPSSDLGITGNAEDQPPEGRVIAGNTLDETNTNLLSLGCTTDSSTDVLDENAVLRRSAAACPANVITPTRPIPPPPILPGPNPNPSRQKTPVDIPEKPKPAGDARCADHDGRPHHLKCGGPEIGVTTTLISMVVNCEKAGKHLTAFSDCLHSLSLLEIKSAVVL